MFHHPFACLPWLLVALLAASPTHADCELLYAPPNIRAKTLAFHYANEQRRAREHQQQPQKAARSRAAGAATPQQRVQHRHHQQH